MTIASSMFRITSVTNDENNQNQRASIHCGMPEPRLRSDTACSLYHPKSPSNAVYAVFMLREKELNSTMSSPNSICPEVANPVKIARNTMRKWDSSSAACMSVLVTNWRRGFAWKALKNFSMIDTTLKPMTSCSAKKMSTILRRSDSAASKVAASRPMTCGTSVSLSPTESRSWIASACVARQNMSQSRIFVMPITMLIQSTQFQKRLYSTSPRHRPRIRTMEMISLASPYRG
mmetsp:Transcript_109415/g.309260  ORF Transcript_109415/g.309260 Transcript_109415/m.309260 type:complete len:233 (+) Transcript_109415:417-1115(+)